MKDTPIILGLIAIIIILIGLVLFLSFLMGFNMMRSGIIGNHDNYSMMGDSTDLTALENAKPFDKAFIEEMVQHHRMAVMMSQMLLRNSNNPEMRSLAESIIKAQNSEIEQ